MFAPPLAIHRNVAVALDVRRAAHIGRFGCNLTAEKVAEMSVLPDDTLVYCGHEYTEANGRFAESVDPGNAALKAEIAEDRALRARGEATVPCHLGVEKRTNPFLRADDPGLAAALGMAGKDAAEVFAVLRQRKDTF